jgi:hypothetical protein
MAQIPDGSSEPANPITTGGPVSIPSGSQAPGSRLPPTPASKARGDRPATRASRGPEQDVPSGRFDGCTPGQKRDADRALQTSQPSTKNSGMPSGIEPAGASAKPFTCARATTDRSTPGGTRRVDHRTR